MTIVEMLDSHPEPSNVRRELLGRAVDSMLNCAALCASCADACLAEENPAELRDCIQSDLACADICATTAKVIARQTAPNWKIVKAQVQACLVACQECGGECEKHADHHEHCRICAEACHSCEMSCQELLDALPAST
ncbi:MAG: four-helix bundle copper-binding protein [Thermomicrobiales bacterium]